MATEQGLHCVFTYQEEMPEILSRVSSSGYKIFKDGLENLNIIAVRAKTRVLDVYDDSLFVVFKRAFGAFNRVVWVEIRLPCSVDPGFYYTDRPMRSDGAAHICPGQYRGAYSIGIHKGNTALVQVGPVSVRRDTDRDGVAESVVSTGIFGINIHDSGRSMPASVGRWSAGCIAVRSQPAFEELIKIAKSSVPLHGDRFTLTVLED